MDRLNNGVAFPEGRVERTEKVLQFGEGVFLRAFLDELFDDLNQKGLFDGGVAVVQPRPGGKAKGLNEQDGLYTLLLRGIEKGEKVDRHRVISTVTRGIDPYKDYEDYVELVRSPELRFVVSNTTEAGIAYRAEDQLCDRPAVSFPGKVAQVLYERFCQFEGAEDKGLIFLPCELIEQNGAELKRIVLMHAADWALGDAFVNWIDSACVFANTLVDRIVSGYPQGEAEKLCEALGYEDRLLDAAEPYSLFAIEGVPNLTKELRVDRAELNVLVTDDIAPYRTRKVRILNGAHSALTPVALLMGKKTVGESMCDPLLRAYLTELLYGEVIKGMGGDETELGAYAKTVFERFENPFIEHQLTGIALNTTSKWRARLLPSLRAHQEKTSELPKLITFAFAAAMELFESGREDIKDADNIRDLYEELKQSVQGFGEAIEASRESIRQNGCRKALEMSV